MSLAAREHVAGRSVAKTALLGAKLFGPDVSVAKASRCIETFALVLPEGAMSQDELYVTGALARIVSIDNLHFNR